MMIVIVIVVVIVINSVTMGYNIIIIIIMIVIRIIVIVLVTWYIPIRCFCPPLSWTPRSPTSVSNPSGNDIMKS